MNTQIRRLLAVLAMAAGLGLLVAACGLNDNYGSGTTTVVSYEPNAYGVNGQCFYENFYGEVALLKAAGLCQQSWVATPMPGYWLNQYYSYYNSAAFYDHYVPAGNRNTYVTVVHNYGSSHASSIKTAASKATYKSSAGQKVSGSTISTSKTTFGSGKSFTSTGSKSSGSGRSGTSTGSKSGSGISHSSGSGRTNSGSSSGRSSGSSGRSGSISHSGGGGFHSSGGGRL